MNTDPLELGPGAALYTKSRAMVRMLRAENELIGAMDLIYRLPQYSDAIEAEMLAVRTSIKVLAAKLDQLQQGSQPAS